MSIGLIVQINNVENKISTFTCSDIIDSKNTLINFLFEEFKKIENDDLPFFTYYIYNQEWNKPWTNNEIHNIVLKKLDKMPMPLTRTDTLSEVFFLEKENKN
jgi:hypothetical protein